MQVGDKVRVKNHFGLTFQDEYIIASIQDGVYFLDGIDGGFDALYLEAV